MADGIFIYSYSETSQRFVILDELGEVAFIYLSEKGSQKPEKDALAYMRITPPKEVSWKEMAEAGKPPILSEEYASSMAVLQESKESHFAFKWSVDGESAALLYKGSPIAFISSESEYGYSKAVSKSNPISSPWDQNLYEQIFGK
ncbi:hypothetical protein OQJ46_00780 [Microbulbifer thermotolerans]|uniref:hypothetical protein n=1 Tax=Microbulbifer thermotolerans TaxID=252514 RepID=UPI00224B1E8C|nr:hypothetical protein [Microbulbifer thermotolerans]MCX2781522.1 hypothetical protein [Microbulbifer thermotolerans]MCX2842308.1 hypothetical protein [Microbulbifer thermotolerans]